VTDVKIDRELAFADVYISALEGAIRSVDVLAGLESAAGFFRRNLASRVEMRAFPKLRFHGIRRRKTPITLKGYWLGKGKK